eukprot:scaffold1146_cov399-Prasinococcus_capsulatus_cf.AAC.24
MLEVEQAEDDHELQRTISDKIVSALHRSSIPHALPETALGWARPHYLCTLAYRSALLSARGHAGWAHRADILRS